MAIVKNRLKGEFLPSRDSMSADEDELRRHTSGSEPDSGGEDGDEEEDDDDSGMASEDVDLSELGEPGEELVQVGNQLCSVPFELYDLPGLGDILSVEVWNECLSEEERFELAKYLPDADQEGFVGTMRELLSGENFHFGSPIVKLFDMLKGGLCDPRVLLYRHGQSCLEKFKHHHHVREYQNSMVGKFAQIKKSWSGCRAYGIEERLRVLNLMRSQKGLLCDEREDMAVVSDSSDGLWTKRLKDAAPVGGGLPKLDPVGSYPSDRRGLEPRYDMETAEPLVGVPLYSVHDGLKTQGKNRNVNKYLDRSMDDDYAYSAKTGARLRNQNYGRANSPWETQPNFRRNKNNTSSYLNVENYGSSLPQMHEMLGPPSRGSRKPDRKTNRQFVQNGLGLEEYAQSDETESDSDEEESGYPSSVLERRGNANKHPKYSSKARQDVELYSLKGKQNAKIHEDPWHFHNYRTPEESDFSNFVNVAYDAAKRSYKSPKMDRVSVKNKKGFVGQDYRSSYARHYMEDESDLRVTRSPGYLDPSMKIDTMGRRVQTAPNMPLLEWSSTAKKRKGKVDARNEYANMYGSPQQQLDDPSPMRKRGKRELEAENDSLALMDVDSETKPGKKPFTLITPSVHTDFSFSIIHFLSAVRVAMVTPLAEDASEQNANRETPSLSGAKNIPSLTVQEIVNRVKSNPGDPCILETQEPLQDLVRGVLKIFSSKTAPLGAKGWKALVSYEKPTKSWSWIGPVSSGSSDPDTIEEVTSIEAWGLPHKMLVKLVDSFANWLKNGQETLQQIGSLPPPPLELMQPTLDEKERFRDLRAQKSLTTISPSSEEVRDYFRKEECLRYLVPDRAFSYTAVDGKKSIVAPLRRGGGKPTSKARDHPILKPDRPPHVTILCLVRDAASRLPGSIGTRADVCTLIRDSQYIVEDVTDAQVNQVVSGALDRLHYERDPCVQFDGERKLWVYLHRDREEEDFEDDGTSSTKKWKRPRKEAAEHPDSAAANLAYQQVAGGSDVAYAANTDVKVEPSFAKAGQGMGLVYHSLRSNEDENSGLFVGSERGRLHLTGSTDWGVLNLNSMRENKNATNEDYNEEAFSRDRSVGHFGASIKNGVT